MTQKEGKVGCWECSAPAHQHLFLTGQLCTWTKCAQLHWFFGAYGGKTLLPSPWWSTKIVHSHHFSQTWGYSEGKKMFHEPRTQLHWVLAAAAKAIRVEKILKQKVILSGHKLREPVSLLLSASLSPHVSHWLPREAPQISKVTLKDIPWSFSRGIRHYKDTFHIFGVWGDWLHTSK